MSQRSSDADCLTWRALRTCSAKGVIVFEADGNKVHDWADISTMPSLSVAISTETSFAGSYSRWSNVATLSTSRATS